MHALAGILRVIEVFAAMAVLWLGRQGSARLRRFLRGFVSAPIPLYN